MAGQPAQFTVQNRSHLVQRGFVSVAPVHQQLREICWRQHSLPPNPFVILSKSMSRFFPIVCVLVMRCKVRHFGSLLSGSLLVVCLGVPSWSQPPTGLPEKAAPSKRVDLTWGGPAANYTIQRAPL